MSLGERKHDSKKSIESEVVEMLQKKEYSLNTVNNYGDSLLHIGAANGCVEILKAILMKNKDCNVDRKNKFGWTPLMHAIRNGNIGTVDLLLQHGASIDRSTYLGMSALGLAAAISGEMFDTVYKSCPAVLENAANDDVTPLCVAAMRNDKKLFFKLLDLGMEVSKANEYTQLMMRQSTVPEITALAKQHLDIEDYWEDNIDDIEIKEDSDDEEPERPFLSNRENDENIEQGLQVVIHSEEANDDNNNKEGPTRIFVTQPKIRITRTGSSSQKTLKESEERGTSQLLKKRRSSLKPNLEKLDLLSLSGYSASELRNSITPNLSYNLEGGFDKSPNMCYTHNEFWKSLGTAEATPREGVGNNSSSFSAQARNCSEAAPPSQRLQNIRPPDIEIKDHSVDLNTSLSFVPEFSPSRSPHLPPEVNVEDSVFGENTPTPPHCKTPPRGMVVNSEQAKLIILLKQFDLGHQIPIFLEQEVDMELFLTLNNEDLREIGIANKGDRRALLELINECKKSER